MDTASRDGLDIVQVRLGMDIVQVGMGLPWLWVLTLHIMESCNHGILECQGWFSHREGGENNSQVVLAGRGRWAALHRLVPTPVNEAQ